jgi:DNA polymerase
MSGFFTKQETASEKRPKGKTLSCHSCGLFRDVLTPKMAAHGYGRKGIMIIGDRPRDTDDTAGIPFTGKYGRLLKATLSKFDIELYEDCISLNAINCRPKNSDGEDRPETPHEIDCCRRIVLAAIKQYKPKVIILLGVSALTSVVGHRWKGALDGIQKWRGFTIPDQDLQCWVCPTLHPSNVMKYEKNEGVQRIWEMDLQKFVKMTEVDFPKYKEPEIITLQDDLSVLETIPNLSTVAFDYETSGLKPHKKGHKIISASVAVSPDKVYVFVMPRKAEQRKPFVKLLKNVHIKKMAHNMKFEHNWSKVILKTTVKGWYWDSMLASHLLDNRQGVTNLKFQAYINFGIVDYSSSVDKYLKSAENANDFNKAGLLLENEKQKKELLKYNALDSIFEYRLALIQQEIVRNILPF